MARALPDSIVINTKGFSYVCRNEKKGYVQARSDSVFNPEVRIKVERSKEYNDHVHLRFTHTNKYWQRNGVNSDDIVAVSNNPEENKEKPTCTLFKPVVESDVVYLTHAQTGRPVVFDEADGLLSLDRSGTTGSPLRFVDVLRLVKLPKNVAFKAVYNGCFLKGELYLQEWSLPVKVFKYLRFNSSDRDEFKSGHEVFLMNDGHVRIKSNYYGRFWRQTGTWIAADTDDVTANDKDTLFWPVKIKDNVIALKSAANGLFCKGLSRDSKNDCLNAFDSDTKSNETHLEVHELVKERIISNVRYRKADAKIDVGMPSFIAPVPLNNRTDSTVSLVAEIEYKNEKSYSFSQGLSVASGVSVSIKADLPFAGAEVEGGYRYDKTESSDWGHTDIEATAVKASATVPVPPRSKVTVDCFARKGTCTIPFSYTREDHVTDEDIRYYEETDGIYEGVSYYSIEFEVANTQRI